MAEVDDCLIVRHDLSPLLHKVFGIVSPELLMRLSPEDRVMARRALGDGPLSALPNKAGSTGSVNLEYRIIHANYMRLHHGLFGIASPGTLPELLCFRSVGTLCAVPMGPRGINR